MSKRGPRSDAGLWASLNETQREIITGKEDQKTAPKIALKYGGKDDDKPTFAKWASPELIEVMLKFNLSAKDVGDIVREYNAKGDDIKEDYIIQLISDRIQRGKSTLNDDEKIDLFGTIINLVLSNVNAENPPSDIIAKVNELTKKQLSGTDVPHIDTSRGRVPIPIKEFGEIQEYISSLGREPKAKEVDHALSMLNKTLVGKVFLGAHNTPKLKLKLLNKIMSFDIPIEEPADDEQGEDEQIEESAEEEQQPEPKIEEQPLPTTVSQKIDQATQPPQLIMESKPWWNFEHVFSNTDTQSLETPSTSKLDFPTTETSESQKSKTPSDTVQPLSDSAQSLPPPRKPPALLSNRIARAASAPAQLPESSISEPLSGDARMNDIAKYMEGEKYKEVIEELNRRLAINEDMPLDAMMSMITDMVMKKEVPMSDKPKTITETIDRVRMITDELRQGNIGFIDFVNDLSSFGRFIRPDEFDKYAESISPYLVGLRDTEGQKLFKNIDQVIGFLHSIYYKQDDGRKNEIRIVKAMRKEAHPQIKSSALQRSAMPVVHHRWIYRY